MVQLIPSKGAERTRAVSRRPPTKRSFVRRWRVAFWRLSRRVGFRRVGALCLLAVFVALRHLTYRMVGAVFGGGLVASAIILPPFYRLWRLFPDLQIPHDKLLFVGSFEPLAGVVNYLRYSMQSFVCLRVLSPDLPLWIEQRCVRTRGTWPMCCARPAAAPFTATELYML